MALIFDSLTTARVLQSKGFSAQQAEGIAEQMNQLLIQDIASKSDMTALRTELTGEMATLRTELTAEIAGVRGEMASLRTELKGDIAGVRTEMKTMASELTVKIYSVGLAAVALVIAAQKLLP